MKGQRHTYLAARPRAAARLAVDPAMSLNPAPQKPPASGGRLYQPAATPEQIHQLWLLAQPTGQPMTAHLRAALAQYLAAHLQDDQGAA